MATVTSTIDYGKALGWYSKDKKFWPTVLTLSLYILSCIFIIPILYVIPYIAGYVVAVTRNIQRGLYELPELSGSYWKEGAILMLVSMLASGVFIGLFFAIVIGGSVLSEILAESSPAVATAITFFTGIGSLLVQAVMSLFVPFIYFAMYAFYAKTGEVSSIFMIDNYRTLWQKNSWTIVISYFLYAAVSSALTGVGLLVCCIGVLPAMVVVNFIMAGLVGQLDVEGIV